MLFFLFVGIMNYKNGRDEMKFEEKRVNHKLQYHCSFLDLYEDDVELPNGKVTKRVYVEHLGAAAILPITKDGHIVLTKQYRYPIGQVSLEVPAGKKDQKNEDGASCAIRELEEETSLVSENIVFVQTIFSCVGYSNEAIDLFVAFDCVVKDDAVGADEDEFIEAVTLSVEECRDLLDRGKIRDVKTAVLLQHYFLVYGGGTNEK